MSYFVSFSSICQLEVAALYNLFISYLRERSSSSVTEKPNILYISQVTSSVREIYLSQVIFLLVLIKHSYQITGSVCFIFTLNFVCVFCIHNEMSLLRFTHWQFHSAELCQSIHKLIQESRLVMYTACRSSDCH